MIYVEAPNPEILWPTVFLAGGITGTWDWQAELVGILDGFEFEGVIINPRRAEWDMADEDAAEKQINWEWFALKKADLISFWFPRETLCPITLFELGKWLHTKPIIGVERGYQRVFDVEQQVALEWGQDYKIHTDLESFAESITHESFMRTQWAGEGSR